MRNAPQPPHSHSIAVALVCSALALTGCDADHHAAALFELAEESAFSGHPGTHNSRAFDVLATDMDLDGDPDLLVNWHHRVPLELYENEAGHFRRVNVPGSDRSGLDDVPGIASLFADKVDMQARIAAFGRAGLYVWHDVQRRGSWRFWWKGDGESPARFTLELTTALSIEGTEGIEQGEVSAPDERTRRLTFDRGPADFEFAVKTEQLSSNLGLRLGGITGEPLSIFAGLDQFECAGGEVAFWKPDPHGMAWGDVEGAPEPELYVTRGGLIGKLVEPSDPKRDRYYLGGQPGGPWFVPAAEDTIPLDRGRGRAVEWVDVDNDGRLELAVSNKDTPNKLLWRPGDGEPFRDVAPAYGVDLAGAEVQCWGDHDGDGWQDLYYLRGHTIDVMRNRGGGVFEHVEGATLGLELPPQDPPSSSLFNFCALRLVDFDNDGDLDLWVLMFGDELTNHLFVRETDRFSRATDRVGLGAVRGNITAVLCDVDNDGFEDVISNRPFKEQRHHALLWHNNQGKTLDVVELAAVVKPVHIATNLDVDGDGRWDIACMGTDRYLLRNVSKDNSWVGVALRDRGREPVGALVKAHYDDGAVVARRYGSAYNSAYSQTLRPLRFGVKAGRRLERITVRWPGERDGQPYDPPDLGQTKRIDRPE